MSTVNGCPVLSHTAHSFVAKMMGQSHTKAFLWHVHVVEITGASIFLVVQGGCTMGGT